MCTQRFCKITCTGSRNFGVFSHQPIQPTSRDVVLVPLSQSVITGILNGYLKTIEDNSYNTVAAVQVLRIYTAVSVNPITN